MHLHSRTGVQQKQLRGRVLLGGGMLEEAGGTLPARPPETQHAATSVRSANKADHIAKY